MMMVMKESDTSYGSSGISTLKSKRLRRRPDQHFASYISFGYGISIVLAIFVFLYLVILLYFSLVVFQRGIKQDQVEDRRISDGTNGQSSEHKIQPAFEKIKSALDGYRHNLISDGQLIKQAKNEISQLRKIQRMNMTALHVNQKLPALHQNGEATDNKSTDGRNGFIVLGMHRSGTSMLSGLMVTGLGYYVGSPLIGGAFDNEKGFFELIPVVLQNDEFMNAQQIDWSYNVVRYDYKKGYDLANANRNDGSPKFQEGRKALEFLNSPQSTPWLQKDPRMCITLKTWLPLLSKEPAIVWTYRHPMEVSHSLISREKTFTLDHALRLWIVYNMRALQNSMGLCRVYTSNEDVLKNPMAEVQRISDELTSKCNVPKPPNTLTTEQVSKFVDTTLQHNTKSKFDDGPIIEQHGADCKVHELVTTTKTTDSQYEIEFHMYRRAMKIYCDMKSGAAYKDDYAWPDL